MSRPTIATCKFVGSISLGLLTGLSCTLSTLTLPSLLSLPSATSAHTTFLHLQTRAKTHLRALAALSTTTLVLAYALAPRRGRHPYLLWTALTVALSGGVDFALRHDEEQLRRTRTDEGEGGVNGEMVRRSMERFRVAQLVRAGVAGCGFGMSVVGIWGDGF